LFSTGIKKDRLLSAEIWTGQGAAAQLGNFLQSAHRHNRRYFLLSDRNTHLHCLSRLDGQLPETCGEFSIAPGEGSKSLEKAREIWEWLQGEQASRDDILVCLGGGVVTDLGGFTASLFKRGMGCIHIPTTLIGMADAAIGGKTGVNLGYGKNQIGCFHHPLAVFIDPVFLETLEEDQLRSGFAELFKCALLTGDRAYEKAMHTHHRDTDGLMRLIQQALDVKMKYVRLDPEDHGARRALNFGHTLGHAIESLAMKRSAGGILHGEAVALGMIGEGFLSWRITGFCWTKLQEYTAFLKKYFPEPPLKAADADELISIMKMDKKNKGGKILFSLLKDTGDPAWDMEVEEEMVRKAIGFILKDQSSC